MKFIYILLFSILFIHGCGGGDESSSQYDENLSLNDLNPDRGIYDSGRHLSELKTYNTYQAAKDDGYNLVYADLELDNYVDVEVLPDDFMQLVEHNFADINTSGIKIIFRIRYRESDGYDPSKEIILSHLTQLTPLLQKYKNVISIVQAGLIGAHGEWHSFSGDFADDNVNYVSNRREIIEKLANIFPDKYIQIRTPMHKELLFGSSVEYRDKADDAEITKEIAYTSDIKARIAHHNDCFLASEIDMGTYASNNIDFWKDYVVNDSKYSPVGGETCLDDIEFTNCKNALLQLKKFRWSFINGDYNRDVIDRWKSEGCYETIKSNVGYRLILDNANVKKVDNNLNIELAIFNGGYSSPYIKYNVSLILKSDNNIYEFKQDVDTRLFYPSEIVRFTATLSLENVANDTYELYLKIGDGTSWVRLTNRDIWNENIKSNRVFSNIDLN